MNYATLFRNYVRVQSSSGSTLALSYLLCSPKKQKMKTKPIGMVLIVIGIILLAYTGVGYATREKVIDIGTIEITKQKNHYMQWPPIAGIALVVGGVVLLAVGKKTL